MGTSRVDRGCEDSASSSHDGGFKYSRCNLDNVTMSIVCLYTLPTDASHSSFPNGEYSSLSNGELSTLSKRGLPKSSLDLGIEFLQRDLCIL